MNADSIKKLKWEVWQLKGTTGVFCPRKIINTLKERGFTIGELEEVFDKEIIQKSLRPDFWIDCECVIHDEGTKKRLHKALQDDFDRMAKHFQTTIGMVGFDDTEEKAIVGQRNGRQFLQEVRVIIEECSKLKTPERAARVTAFAICVMLDGSGESLPGGVYALSVLKDDGLEPVEFKHDELGGDDE